MIDGPESDPLSAIIIPCPARIVNRASHNISTGNAPHLRVRLLYAILQGRALNETAKPQGTPSAAGLAKTEEDDPMKKPFRMNLQLFAEPEAPEGAPQPEPTPAPPAPEGQPGAQQMFTVEDVQKLIQSEADKRVTQALAKQKKEYEKKLSLSGLDEQQRELAERDQTIEDLREQLKEANAKQLKADLVQALAGRGLPISFADLIDVGEDAAEAQRRVEALDAGFRAAVEEAVKARLSGGAPGRGSTKPPMTREEFGKLSIAEMQKLAKEQPELYKTLTQ